jgi:hypothetical protein
MLRPFDAHVHLFDCKANTYAFLEHEDRSFKAIAGDYSALPRRYLTDDYLNHEPINSTRCNFGAGRRVRFGATWVIKPRHRKGIGCPAV